jgi:predicted nuclease with RNAse H fold
VHPLAVSADRIAAVAMRGAGVLSRLSKQGRDVTRDGSGLVVETYPAAALRSWGLPSQSCKGRGKREALAASVDALEAGAPLLDLGVVREVIRESDDVFDAVVCALVARARVLGLVSLPPLGSEARARRKGWMCLPGRPLVDLFV